MGSEGKLGIPGWLGVYWGPMGPSKGHRWALGESIGTQKWPKGHEVAWQNGLH